MAEERPAASFAALDGQRREQAMARFAVLRPHLEENVPLARAAGHAGVPVRTAERWLARYRRGGLVGLARPARRDAGTRRMPADLVTLVEGMALKPPRSSAAAIHRRVNLAQEEPAAYRDRFELIHRHRADDPNALWQADHTLLDLLILDEGGKPARPWLTTVVDDHSRAVAGYMVFLGAPSVLNTSLALRHAIWRKADPAWPICGVPDVLYVDHGSDFTSQHLDLVAAALRIQMIHSAVARPQGRGKVERLFGTLNTELLPELPGHLLGGKPATPPRLSLAELDRAVGAFVAGTYHLRSHGETGQAPLDAWRSGGFLPRLPESLEDLDLLLIMHAQPRMVRRDGIRFQGLRYASPTLAGYVREPVTIRYDPRDLSEVRVFHCDRFLCRAVSEEHAGEAVTLKDIEAARRAHRLTLRAGINERVSRVADYLPAHADTPRREGGAAGPDQAAHLRGGRVMTAAAAGEREGAFIATKEHRRFVEFAKAVRQHHYIGLCYGPAGVGKTLSARRYAHWNEAEPVIEHWGLPEADDAGVQGLLARSRTVFRTAAVLGTLRDLRDTMANSLVIVSGCIEEQLHREGVQVRRQDRHRLVEMVIIDEAERMQTATLELVRDIFDRTGMGVILIGMPGMERRLSRYPQLYSRVGFAHHYRPLQGDELTFVLTRHWRRLGLALDDADFTDAQAIASIARVTGGNFRLLHRLFVQIGRILKINGLSVITDDVVEAARSTLVIGAT